TDVQVVNGASGGTGDVFTLAASGANAFFERTNFGLFSVTTSAVETFEVNSLADNDLFNVGNLAGTGVANVTYTGGPGTDTLDGTGSSTPLRSIWNGGDGSDVVLGGSATDVQVVNGSSGTTGDVMTIVASAQNAVFERTNLVPFSVTTDDIEVMEVNGFAGNDSLTVGSLSSTGVTGVTFVGGQGSDTLTGTSTSTSLTSVWNNGDGTDVFFAGSGTDVQIVNGSNSADDTFLLSSLADQGFFQRTNLVPFSITTEEVDEFFINGLGGNENITVSDLSATSVTSVSINGGEGDEILQVLSNANTSMFIDGGNNGVTGDSLTLDVHGVTPNQSISPIQVGTDQPVIFQNIEEFGVINTPSRIEDFQVFE
ncbi:MAG: hypothetical protein SFY68_03950, partial [Candidatus Sumerlaeia bacterium]|nr:hypothetical protein [Candidatus Sumerlaeia bacterium]